jgi:hypothetical protein
MFFLEVIVFLNIPRCQKYPNNGEDNYNHIALPYISEYYVYLKINIKIYLYRSIILPVVLHRYEIWCLTLWEENKLSD